jgi:hypothetical protein
VCFDLGTEGEEEIDTPFDRDEARYDKDDNKENRDQEQ